MTKMQDKKTAYNTLVKKRKSYKFPEGLLNPSEIENGKFDTIDYIGPWSAWQGN